MVLGTFLQWLLKATFQGSLLVCVILLIKTLLRDRLPARWHYGLWLVLLVRLSLPWSVQSSLSIYGLFQPMRWAKPIQSAAEGWSARPAADSRVQDVRSTQGEASIDPDARPMPAGQAVIDSLGRRSALPMADHHKTQTVWAKGAAALPMLWLAGVIALTACVLLRNVRLWWAVKGERPVTDQQTLDLLEDCKMRMRVQTVVGVVITDRVGSPALFGVIRPRILLPQGLLEAVGLEELHYVFVHELAHLKRRDIYLAWLVCVLQVLHWFNPLIWLAFRRMRIDQEMATDALALSIVGTDEPHLYGRTIVNLLERFSRPQYSPSLAGILENPSHIERRMAMIARFTKSSYRWSPLGLAAVAVLGIVSMIDPTRGAVSTSPTPQTKPAVTMRLVQEEVWGDVSMSPDRRYLCHTGWEQGEIFIRELATGEQRMIKPTKRVPEESKPSSPILSPDNKTIAYHVGFRERSDVCLIGADGSGQRVLYPGIIRSILKPAGFGPALPYPGHVRPVQWFPDGSRFLAMRWPDVMHFFNDIEIVSVSLADGSTEVIKKLTGEFYGTTIKLSPDAKTVAYELASKDTPKKRDIFAIDIDSKQEMPLVVHAANNRLLDWTPDGRHILFVSDRMGPWSIWLLPVAKGQGQGVPELVGRSTGPIGPVGFAEDGSYCYRMAYRDIDIHTAVVDLATGQLLSAPARLGVAGSDVADWSPDGKYLAYCAPSATSSERRVIRICSLDTGQEREIPDKVTGFEYLRWCPDGRSLLASGLVSYKPEDVLLPGRVYRIDAVTGETMVLLDTKEHEVRMAELSPDGKILYYTTNGIIRREIDTGQEKILFTYSPKAPWAGSALSPNGEFIAVASNEGTKEKAEGGVKKILLIPSQGGQATELLRWDQEPASFLTQTGWSGDGKTVLFALHREPVAGKNPKEVNEFWQVSVEGGLPRKIFETNLHMQYSRCFRVHPDGQRILLSVTTAHGELWAMENFLPAGSGANDAK